MKPADIRVGDVIHTLTIGRVRVQKINGDELECRSVSGVGQILLSRKAAVKRPIETVKGAKK